MKARDSAARFCLWLRCHPSVKMASHAYQHLPDVVGVIGAGQMGVGIATILARCGLKVILSDRKFDIIERGLSVINKNLEKQIKAGKLTADEATATLGRIETAVSLEPFRGADFVIEAAPEDEEIKKVVVGAGIARAAS